MNIVPSLLESDSEQFRRRLEKLVGFADRIQVDFNDGSFEKTKTLGPEDIARIVVGYTNKILFEAHLMVQKPLDYVPKLIEAGFKKIIVQYEIEGNLREIIEQILLEDILVGVAVGPETSIFDADPILELVDTVNILDIEPGKQGQGFLPKELAKVADLHEENFLGEIQVDGAITVETIDEVAKCQPSTLVVGHYIVAAEEPREKYEELRSKLVENRIVEEEI